MEIRHKLIFFKYKKLSEKGGSNFYSSLTFCLHASPCEEDSSHLSLLLHNSKNPTRPWCPNFVCCGSNNTGTNRTSDSIGPSPTCPSIICTHCINGADGVASAATQNHQHKKPSSTVIINLHVAPLRPTSPLLLRLKSSTLKPPIDLNSKCKTARVHSDGKNLSKSLFYILCNNTCLLLIVSLITLCSFTDHDKKCDCIKLPKNRITLLKCELFISLKNMQMQTIVSNM
jgi:hypothetical protein